MLLTVYGSRMSTIGIAVEKRFNDLQKIYLSREETLQVLSNVISNAIEAMRLGGSLKVSTRKLSTANGDGIQAVIRDNGIGIAQQDLERVFDPFFTTKGEVGTGIGLWVAKQLVEKRGGQISIASSTEPGNSGTSVTIFFPFADPASRPPNLHE